MSRIQQVVPLSEYRLEIILDNGHSVILNMESRLETLRFGQLADPAFFKRVTTDGKFVRWDKNIEISVSEVFQLAQK